MPAGAARHPIPDRAFGISGRAFRRPLLTCHARSDLLTLACCDLIAPRWPDFGKIPGEFQKRPHRAAQGGAKIAGAACVLPQLQSAHWPVAGDRSLTVCRFIRPLVASVLTVSVLAGAALGQAPESRFADVNGTRLHYLAAGKGDAILLLHGYAQTSHMWRPLIAQLAKTNAVIAPDLRGFGQSAKPAGGYDKKTMAQDIHALATSIGYKRVKIAGHDIGLMVAYAYAVQYPAEVD
ncbi:MAG: alpha/beta fold hydrolase, partial [Xanthobacteraceae bacterium]